jgi:hypothetical protein
MSPRLIQIKFRTLPITEMKTTIRHLCSTVAVLALVAFMPSISQAEQPGKHPAYLHALEDLRHARAHLERRRGDAEVKWDEHVAIKEIDAAIAEIKSASIDDGKDLADHPPVDAKADYRGRLHRAAELLHKAHADIKEEEDNNFAHGLQHRAIEHIDAALNFTEQGIANVEHR